MLQSLISDRREGKEKEDGEVERSKMKERKGNKGTKKENKELRSSWS